MAEKLKNMEPMLRDLELSLDGTKNQLKEEVRLRQQAEVAKEEAQARLEQTERNMVAMKKENEALGDELGTVHQELATKSKEYERLRQDQTNDRNRLQHLASRIGSSIQDRRDERSEKSSLLNADSGVVTEMASNKTKSDTLTAGDDSYSEVLDELETVTEQLISTQQKLWRTEDHLRESEAHVQELQTRLRVHGDKQPRKGKSDEIALRRELEEIRTELIACKRESEAVSEQSSRWEHQQREIESCEIEIRELTEQNKRMRLLNDHVIELEQTSKRTHEQLSHYEQLLEEIQEENARLVEEVACLRDILHDVDERDSVGGTLESSETNLRETIAKEVKTKVITEANKVREKEINALREQFKKIFRENTALNEKIEKLETGAPSLSLGKEDYKLKKEIERLSEELQAAKAEHHKIISETEASWRKKFEQVMTGEFISEDLLEEMEDEMKAVLDSAAERVRSLQQDKGILTDRMEELARELHFMETKIINSSQLLRESEANLNDSHDEVLRLKKSNAHLTAELEYTTKIMSRMDAECERLTQQHSMFKAELEVALDVIETSGFGTSSTINSETLKLKEKNHTLTTKLDKLKEDYSALLDELEMSRGKFLDSQEEAGKKSEAEVKFLSEKILELEELLEKSKLEKQDLSKRIQAARIKQDDAPAEGDIERKNMPEADIEKLQNTISELEQDLKEAKKGTKPMLKELKQVKDALASSRIENKKLEEEMAKIKEEGARKSAIETNSVATADRSESRADIDPLEETLVSGYPLIRSGSWDPQSARGTFNPDCSVSRDMPSGFGHVRLRLEEMTLENEFLNEKILSMSKHNPDTSLNEEIDRLKTQLGSKTRELKEVERKFKEVRRDLEEAEGNLKQAENVIDQGEAANNQMKSKISALQDVVHDARQNEADLVRDLERTKSVCTELQNEIDAQAKTSLEETLCSRQMHELAEENLAIQQLVAELEDALARSQTEVDVKKREIDSLDFKLMASQEEIRLLSEEIARLSVAFEKAQREYDSVVDELDAVNEIFERARDEAEQMGREAAIDEIRASMQGYNEKEKKSMRLQLEKAFADNISLQKKLDDVEVSLIDAKRTSTSDNRIHALEKEIEIVQSALIGSQNEVRILKEKCFDLEMALKQSTIDLDQARDELELSQGQPVHPRLLSAVFDTEEMQELKEQFNALIEENINLEQVVRESEIALTLAKDVEERNKESLQQVGEELSNLKTSKRKLQEEVYNLTVELETSKDDHETILEETRTKMQRDSEANLKVLKNKVDVLLIENATLQTKLRKTSTSAVSKQSQHSENLGSGNIELMQLKDKLSLLEKQYQDTSEEKARLSAQVQKLEISIETMTTSDHGSSEDPNALVSRLALAQEENVDLKSKISQLVETLQQKSDRLRQLQEEFDGACCEAEQRGRESMMHRDAQTDQVDLLQNELRKLTHEKEALLKQVDEVRISKSLASIAQDRTMESEEALLKANEQDLTAASCHVKDEHAATMEVLERINVLLASVEFLERHHEIHLRTSHSRLVSTSQKAEEIRRKVAFLTYALQKSKKEHSDVLLQLKSSKRESKELRSKDVLETRGAITTSDDEQTMKKEKCELEERLEATGLALRTARESEQRHKIEADLNEKKYRETQRAATYLKDQVIHLQEALRVARKDHSSASPQLSAMQGRVAGLKGTGEGRGSLSRVNGSNFNDPGDTESEENTDKELNLYQRISEENAELKCRLEETEAALAAARDMKSHHEAELKKLEVDADKAAELQSSNKGLYSDLESFKSNLVNAKSNREVVRLELESVRQRLDDIQDQENHDSADGRTLIQKEAELRLLQSQFRKLTEQSENLAKQVRDAENSVTIVRDAQEQRKIDINARATLAKELQDQIEEAVDTTKKRDQEMSELTVLMESRVCLTEESIEKLQQEISETKGSLQVSKAGLFVTSSHERAKKFRKMVERSTLIPPEPVHNLKEDKKRASSATPGGKVTQTQEENRIEDFREVETARETITEKSSSLSSSSSSPTRTPMKTRIEDDEIRDGVENISGAISGLASSFRNYAKRARSNSPASRINSHPTTQSKTAVAVASNSANRSSTDRQQLGSTNGSSTPERRKTPISRRASRTSPFLRTLYDVDRLSSSKAASASQASASERDNEGPITGNNEVCNEDELAGIEGDMTTSVTADVIMNEVHHDTTSNMPMSTTVKGWSTSVTVTDSEDLKETIEARGDSGTDERE